MFNDERLTRRRGAKTAAQNSNSKRNTTTALWESTPNSNLARFGSQLTPAEAVCRENQVWQTTNHNTLPRKNPLSFDVEKRQISSSLSSSNSQADLRSLDNNNSSDVAFDPSQKMPQQERTQEFRATAKSLQMKLQGNGLVQPRRTNKLLEENIQFNKIARKIGRDLGNTCAKLEKLAMLSKKKSLFVDRMSEIDELTAIVKQDISGLHKQIAQLQEFVNSRKLAAGESKANAQSHSKSVVVSLQSKLAKLSNNFKEVLEERTENMKRQKSRRDQFSQSQPVPSSMPPSASSGNLGSVLLSDEYNAAGNSGMANGDVSIPMDGYQDQHDRYQEQLQLIDEQDSYIRSRSNAMQNIESTIVELGSIFQQLAHMVQEQGEVVQRIDSHVEETSMNIEAAHMELLKYFRGISQNRWLAMKVFGVLIVFFIIFIVFMT